MKVFVVTTTYTSNADENRLLNAMHNEAYIVNIEKIGDTIEYTFDQQYNGHDAKRVAAILQANSINFLSIQF